MERCYKALPQRSGTEVLILLLLDNAGAGFSLTRPFRRAVLILLLLNNAGGRIRTNVTYR